MPLIHVSHSSECRVENSFELLLNIGFPPLLHTLQANTTHTILSITKETPLNADSSQIQYCIDIHTVHIFADFSFPRNSQKYVQRQIIYVSSIKYKISINGAPLELLSEANVCFEFAFPPSVCKTQFLLILLILTVQDLSK